MTADQLASDLGVNGKEGYFEYIVDSIINGQKKQARELYEELRMSEADEFFTWAENNYKANHPDCSDKERELAMDNLRLCLSR